MRRLSSVVLLLLLAVFSSPLPLVVITQLKAAVSSIQYTPHPPICLVGDNDPGWAEFPGTGTPDDPKRISGLEIYATDHCIQLIDTTLHVVIENCYLHGNNTYYGIYLENATNVVVNSTIIQNLYVGACTFISHDCCFYNCNASKSACGLFIVFSQNIAIKNCILSENKYAGGSLASCSNCSFYNCSMVRNEYDGAAAWLDCTDCSICNCEASENGYSGIYVIETTDFLLANCTVRRNGFSGINLVDCRYGVVSGSWLSENGIGIRVHNAGDLAIRHNVVETSFLGGLSLILANNCLVYDNLFNNTHNCYLFNVTFVDFNVSAYTPGPNIVGGPYLGGNYWSDYAGEDADKDGYGDTLYVLIDRYDNKQLFDHLPLVPQQTALRATQQAVPQADPWRHIRPIACPTRTRQSPLLTLNDTSLRVPWLIPKDHLKLLSTLLSHSDVSLTREEPPHYREVLDISNQPPLALPSLQYVPHDPIYLNGSNDPGWAEFPGSGTPDDPKVIAGYEIIGTNHCIWLVNTSLYVVIENCYLHENYGFSGIRLENAHNVVVRNVVFYNLTYGVYASSCTSCSIQDCRISIVRRGVYLTQCGYTSLCNCTVEECTYAGVSAQSCSSCIVSNCTLQKSDYGVYLARCANFLINACSLLENDIAVYLSSCDSCSLQNSSLIGNKRRGVVARYGSNCSLISCTILGGGYRGDGISLYSSDKCLVQNCSIAGCGYAGIYLRNCTGCTVFGCSTERNQIYGISVIGCRNCRVIECNSSRNEMCGLLYWLCSSCTIQNYTGFKNALAAIGFFENHYCSLLNSTGVGNGECGVYLFSADSGVRNLELRQNGIGVWIEGSPGLVFEGCFVQDSYLGGLSMLHSADSWIFNNFFSNDVNHYLYNVTTCAFNTTAYTPGPNIVGGPYLGGNYWSDYRGVDTDNDGYGDTPYPMIDVWSGETVYDYLPLVFDTGPPTVTITTPANGTVVKAFSVKLQWVVQDDVGVATIEVWLNESLIATLPAEASEYTAYNLSLGWYNATVVAIDYVENRGSDTVWFKVTDGVPPVIEITSPKSGALLNESTVVVSWEGWDNFGIDHYTIALDEGAEEDIGTATNYTYVGLSDGQHAVCVQAYDIFENTATDVVTFIVDTISPSITVVEPENNTVVYTTNVTVRWTVTDNTSGIATCWIRLDDGDWIEVGATATKRVFTDLSYGEHCVTIKAVDRAGNVARVWVYFRVEAPAPLGLPPTTFAIAIVAGASAVVAAVLLLYKRRRLLRKTSTSLAR